ncbi:MAG: hypothetical protein IVW55_09055 [Chloroflexi bacterium]|nr:hypothetical protein [Chloroflexota bacterium]
MEAYRDVAIFGQGVGASAEVTLAEIAPLIDYYEREMGVLPGRLMIAASYLADVKLMDGWAAQPPEAQAIIKEAEALVISVMVRLLNAQQACDCADNDGEGQGKEEL